MIKNKFFGNIIDTFAKLGFILAFLADVPSNGAYFFARPKGLADTKKLLQRTFKHNTQSKILWTHTLI